MVCHLKIQTQVQKSLMKVLVKQISKTVLFSTATTSLSGVEGGMFNTPLYFNVLNIIIINIKYGLDTCQRKSENFTSFNEVWKSLFYLLARAKYFVSTEIIFNNMLKCEILLKLILTFLLCNLVIDFNLNWLGKVSGIKHYYQHYQHASYYLSG